MTGSTRSRRQVVRRHKKRLLAAALCAASFVTGQFLFGGEGPEKSSGAAPSLLGEYSQVKGKLAAAGEASAQHHETSGELKKLRALPALKTAAKALRPAAVQAAGEDPLVAAQPVPVDTQVRPAAAEAPTAEPAGEQSSQAVQADKNPADENLPPIVPAWAMPKPLKRAAAGTASKAPDATPATPQLRIDLGQTDAASPASAVTKQESPKPADKMQSQRRASVERMVAAPAAQSSSQPTELPPAETVTRVAQAKSPAAEPADQPISNVQRLLGTATSENDSLRKADYETRAIAVQPSIPARLDARLDELGVLPPGSPFEAIEQSGVVKLRVRRSVLLRTKVDVYRTAIVDESVCDIVQFTPREVSIIGRAVGQTHVTFWLDNAGTAPLTYLVDVQPDPQQLKADEGKYELLQNVINEMFPDSKIYLVLVADKLLVKGQAKDSEEAAQIMTIVRAQASGVTGPGGFGGVGFGGFGLAQGAATPVLSSAATGGNNGPAYQIINMLRVPGVQQVALKVKIAELNRSAARGFGIDAGAAINFSDSAKSTQLFLASLLNGSSATPGGGTGSTGGTSVVTSFGGQEVNIGLRYLQERGVIRLLSEPTLVTLSGRPATFIAGGEFAVPTVVGSVGLNAVTTDFRAFGAIISFLPTIVDKDRIRLQVAPEFSQINSALTSNNTPGLNVRAATTTVEMREGQTLAIAGLLEDSYKATTVGDLPGLAKIFGRRDTTRSETELIILVTPELVQPMEPEEVPPLPGFDVTEPTGSQFFLHGEIEGNPTQDYRSTVWPRLKRRYGMGGPAMTSGPFGHGQ